LLVNAIAALQSVLGVSGVYDIDQNLDWHVYPNPTSESINLTNLNGQIESVQILNADGKVCGNFQNRQEISLKGYAPGVYFLRVLKDNKVEQRRFILE